jgi:hypothetical protein
MPSPTTTARAHIGSEPPRAAVVRPRQKRVGEEAGSPPSLNGRTRQR